MSIPYIPLYNQLHFVIFLQSLGLWIQHSPWTTDTTIFSSFKTFESRFPSCSLYISFPSHPCNHPCLETLTSFACHLLCCNILAITLSFGLPSFSWIWPRNKQGFAESPLIHLCSLPMTSLCFLFPETSNDSLADLPAQMVTLLPS